MGTVDLGEQLAFYAGALRTLRFCEERRPTRRRFGEDANQRWRLFQGDLTTGDRIDLLLRDADAEWPRAFGARTVFGFAGVAEDEPFGADWRPLDGVDAEKVWRQVDNESPQPDLAKTLGAIAAAWDLELTPINPGPITPTSHFVATGPSAIAALMVGFSDKSDLDWSTQVLCVASPPAHRHLAIAAAALLNITKPTALTAPGAPAQQLVGATLIHSPDAEPADLELARTLAEAAGGA